MPSEVATGPIPYRLLSEHFQACLDLRETEREAYLSGPRVDDPSLREELRSLLSYHARAVAPRPRAARRAGNGRRIAALGALAALLVLGVRAWTLDRVDAALKEDGLRSLRRLLELRTSSIRAWAERQKEAARAVLEDPAFASHVAALAEAAEPRTSPSHAWVSSRMARAPAGLAETGFRVVSPSGAVLCSGGKTGPAPPFRLSDVAVSRPYPDDDVRPLMCVGGPIRGERERVVAFGLFFVPPEREFYGLLAPEGPAELVAFDERSLLLNNLRDAGALRKAGLLPEGETALRVHLRDPGRELTRPETPADPWAPTRMCLSATRGAAGGDAAGYRNLLGRPVLGAWAWLPELDMGLGVEEELDAVLAPARPMRTAFAAVLAVLAAFAGGAFLAGRVPRRTPDSPFGFYVLEGPLGQGGAGDVFLAHHSVLHRPAALKILREPRPGAAAVARFKREARMAGRLAHPNAIQIFEYAETSDGRLYYAMEYVDGLNVAQLVTLEGPLRVARSLYLLKQISGALEEAHGLGLVHRDLKPSNVMIGRRGGLGDVVKILDFGIASCVSGESDDATRSLLGTPGYIAPERIRQPGHLDVRSDIYSFGGVAFHILTGRSVFEGPGPAELIYQALTSERPSPSKLRGEPLPAALERLILACLSLEPEGRPSSMREINEALKAVETPDAWSQDEARAWWSANGEKAARLKSVSS